MKKYASKYEKEVRDIVEDLVNKVCLAPGDYPLTRYEREATRKIVKLKKD